jgi:tRNA(Ile)-lysidine synthase
LVNQILQLQVFLSSAAISPNRERETGNKQPFYGRSGKMPTRLSPLEIQVRKTIEKYGMLTPCDLVVVAVSGGADSVALVLCLHHLALELQLSLAIAHLNHRIRGDEGDTDQDFVREISSTLGLPFITETIEIKQEADRTKENLEQLARQTRYGFLHRAAAGLNAQKIAVGHTLNDQAETALFRFLRGSGIQGLSAIHPVVGGAVIRPLLECTRTEIIDYLKQQGASYREDSTNQDLSYTRNRIRQELIPCLEQVYNPRVIQTLGHTANLAREIWSYIESEALSAFESIHQKTDNGVSLRIGAIATFHPALQKQVLRCALKSGLGSLHGIASPHIDSLLSLCRNAQSGSQIQLPNKSLAIRQYDRILITKGPLPSIPRFCYSLEVPGQCFVPEIGVVFSAELCKMPSKRLKNKSTLAFLEPATLPQILTIRSKEPGDCYGGPGHRKVKKMLIDQKIPLAQRPFLPMVLAGSHVIWIPGFRPARAYETKPGSKTCIALEYKQNRIDDVGEF